MQKYLTLLTVCFFVACSPGAPSEKAPPPPPAAQKITPEQMQEAMMKASAIGVNHRKLDPLVGSYTVEAKFWMQPGGTPEVQTGTADFSWMLNGHYIVQKYESTFQGQPFEGYGVIGYNNVEAVYESGWIDSMGTQMMLTRGTTDPDGTAITFRGEFQCPITDRPMKTRQVLKMAPGRLVFEMYHPAFDGSGEYKGMEIVYTKVASEVKPHGAKKKAKRS